MTWQREGDTKIDWKEVLSSQLLSKEISSIQSINATHELQNTRQVLRCEPMSSLRNSLVYHSDCINVFSQFIFQTIYERHFVSKLFEWIIWFNRKRVNEIDWWKPSLEFNIHSILLVLYIPSCCLEKWLKNYLTGRNQLNL